MKTTIIQDGKLKVVPDYAKVQGILLGTIAAFVIFITTIGPECVSYSLFTFELGTLICAPFRYRNHGSNFEQQRTAFEEDDRESHSTEDKERLPETRSEKGNENF